jgi:NTE family protein
MSMRSPLVLCLFVFLLSMPLSSLPDQSFFDIDEPQYYGFDALEARLEAVKKDRPILALHLSGGSARAFCHIGVLRRLEERGIYPDVIVANSMGSIIGLLYAAGVPLDLMEDIFRHLEYSELFTLKIPLGGGLLDVRGLLSLTQALVGNVDIAELSTPVIVVCEDLRSMRKVIFSQGDFLSILQAAIALPVWFDPVELDEMVLLDGGITNLVPLEPFMDLADATVVSTAFYNRELSSLDPLTVLNMGINVGKSRSAVEDIEKHAPFLIRNDVESYTYMGWSELESIIRSGYDSCDRRIEELVDYLGDRGIEVSAEPPKGAKYVEMYEARWGEIKRRMDAGQRLALPRGFGALQLHPVLFKRHRGSNLLLQENYLALSYIFENRYSGVEFGAFSDFSGSWGVLLDLDTALWGRFFLGLNNMVVSTLEGREFMDSFTYHRLCCSLPLLFGEHIVAGPFLSTEFLLTIPGMEEEGFLSAGLDFRLSGRSDRDFIQEQLSYFFCLPEIHGISNELMFRKRLLGPVQLFSRALFKNSWHPDAGAGISLKYNDFFRGLERREILDSFAVFNNELQLSPESLAFALWETVLLTGFELSAFCDLFLPEAATLSRKIQPSLGLNLSGQAALMGLIPLTGALSAGYDFEVQRPFLIFNLGSVY